jgi:putative nucleotidyltransferase with HDIG domain
VINDNHPTLRYKKSEKIVMPVSELRLGMYVADLDRPWEETPFLFQGFTLETEHDIEVVKQYCDSVTVDIESSVDFKLRQAPGRHVGRHRVATTVTKRAQGVEHELSRAQRTHQASSRLIRTIMDDVRLGKSVDTPAAREAVSDCVDSIIANPHAMALLSRIREKDQYTTQHSLSVSILSVALGRHLGMQREDLIALGMSGLLHDIGKVLIPEALLLKPVRLTDDEMAIMREHTTYGRDILMSSRGAPLKALDVAYAHHEHVDGSGYPRGLTRDQMTDFTRVVAIADTFDAITTDRTYHNARTNMDAFRVLSRGRDTHWDPVLVIQFIESIGIYPAGTSVELSNQLVGIVIETHPTQKLRPKLLVTHSAHGPLKPPVVLDLAKHLTDRDGQKLTIRRVLPPTVSGLDLHRLRENGLLDNLHNLPEYGRVPLSA